MRFFTLTRSFEAIFASGVGLGLLTTVLSFLSLSDGVLWAVAAAWALWSLALIVWLAAMLFGGILARMAQFHPIPIRVRRSGPRQR